MNTNSTLIICRNVMLGFMLTSMASVGATDRSNRNDNSRAHGFEQVLLQLEQMTNQLGQIEEQLQYQQAQLTELQEETIDCTLDRYLNDQCGEGNSPFDLVVSICGSVGGEVGIGGSYALSSATGFEVGAGWGEVIDVNVGFTAEMPGLLTPPGLLPIILPSEVAVGAEGSIGLGMDSCIDGIKIPIGKNIDRDRVIALLSNLEMGAEDVQSALLDAMENTYNNQTVTAALAAKDTFASSLNDFSSEDPLAVFSSPEVANLVSLIPVGDRMANIINDARSMIPEVNLAEFNVCSRFEFTSIGEKIVGLCSFVNDLPDHQLVINAFEKISDIKTSVENIPNVVRDKICALLPDAICDD